MNKLIKELKSNLDTYDKWGFAMGAFFGIAGEMFHRGLDIPHEWGYSPGMACDGRDPYTPEFEICESASDSDLESAGNILDRYTNYLKAKGEDY